MKDMQGNPWINDGNLIAPEVCPMINRVIMATLNRHALRFTWTSLQVNLDTVAEWHQDSGNLGTSAMMVGGEFSGGEFEIEGKAPVCLRNRIIFFDGTLWHRSLKFVGRRLSVVAFTHALTPRCPVATSNQLLQLGFPFPSVLS